MISKIMKFFFPKIPCDCGGDIKEYLLWGEPVYRCNVCDKEVSEEYFFEQIKNSSKK